MLKTPFYVNFKSIFAICLIFQILRFILFQAAQIYTKHFHQNYL